MTQKPFLSVTHLPPVTDSISITCSVRFLITRSIFHSIIHCLKHTLSLLINKSLDRLSSHSQYVIKLLSLIFSGTLFPFSFFELANYSVIYNFIDSFHPVSQSPGLSYFDVNKDQFINSASFSIGTDAFVILRKCCLKTAANLVL